VSPLPSSDPVAIVPGMELLSDADVLRRLVAFDSTSANSNLPIADFICDYLDGPGVRILRNGSPDGRKTNVIALLGPEEGDGARRGLVLSGHMDVVPAREPEWTSDPFTLKETETSYVGRGSADMKGFLALAMNAFRRAGAAALRSPLALLFTYDEEVGTLGAQHFISSWSGPTLPRSAVIGEPTAMRVVRMHKGHLKMAIRLRGKSAHSGYPHLGKNAIETAGHVLLALGELRRALEAERPSEAEHFPDVPFVPLNIGTIHGGAVVNIVPDRCVIEFGLRLLPTMSATAMIERVRAVIGRVVPAAELEFEMLGESPPLFLDARAEVHEAACALVGQGGSCSVHYASDAGWFQTLGMECILFGPGSIEVAHRPNEFLPKAEFHAAPAIIDRLIARFCT
jgi:acetylornithine deacetylase